MAVDHSHNDQLPTNAASLRENLVTQPSILFQLSQPSDDFCPRQIVFTIPGSPAVQVTATEQDGTITFDVKLADGTGNGDLRGLFFDFTDAKLGGLSIISNDGLMTVQSVADDSVLDLGHGNTVKGLTKDGFDVGVGFGVPGIGHNDMVTETHFTLTSSGAPLTLDDIAHMRFAARVTSTGPTYSDSEKVMVVAPAAPDAHDDSYTIFEDNGAGLTSPTHTPTDLVMNVLANDTDGDGDTLTITELHQQPEHGTVAIAADGHSLIYTPEADYAGTVSVEYCVSDGHGGQDNATATIAMTPVADTPTLSYTVAQGSDINTMIITVTANQTDADSSEYLDSLIASVAGGLPSGVTLTPLQTDPAAQPDQIVQAFTLTTTNDTTYHFDLNFTATSVETGNGDTQTGTLVVPIDIDHATATQAAEFDATDQSIWSTGNSFTFSDDRFLGVDTGNFNESTGGALYAGISGHLKLGFQSTLEFDGGNIDATADYDLTVDSTYNHTTDWLNIDTSALLTGSAFNTIGPEGSYTLAFIYDVLLNAYAGVDIDAELFSISKQIDFPSLSVGPGSFDILSIDSNDIGGTIQLPAPLDAFSIDFAWPHLTTSASGGGAGSINGDGSSNNFLQLNLDLDQLISDIAFDGVDPFDPPRLTAGPFFADPDLLNVTVNAGINFLQQFVMSLGNVQGILTFENGATQGFTFGDSLFFGNASAIDAAGNHDGHIDFTFSVAPDATLHNQTDLGFNVGAGVDVLSVELGYDIDIASDSTTLGPVAHWGASVPVASVGVYDSTFALNYGTEAYSFFV